MKFSLFALPALFIGALAAPAAVPETGVAVEKRQISDAYSIVEGLLGDVKQYTGAINTTAASISSTSTASEKKAAAKSYRTNVKAITALVKTATSQVDGLSAAALKARQTGGETGDALAALVAELLEEISGALNNVIATLGLTSLLGSLTPLVSSLSGLLLSLKNVVDNLLVLVKQIVDGLLIGLSVGLSGLIL